ncbi:mitochondrial large subunit ribosomal protein-domain-containing protein [Xylaria palmicola]|nr:mitochondrial large subunit ribosomal protein-domain-containing protein [Xylaria palmicola]
MLSRTFRPITARASSLAAASMRSNRALGPFCIRTLTTPADAPADATIATTTANKVTDTQRPNPDLPARRLPYYVSRNNLNNYAVYQKTKAGGSKKFTILKYVQGDLEAIRADLGAALAASHSDVVVNPVTKHIHVKVSTFPGV